MAASVSGAVINIILNYLFICPDMLNLGYISAGYTTLICYILYALGHYICMRWVCRKHLDGVRVYDPKILLGLSVFLIVSGLLMTFTYELPVLRYSLVGIVLLLLIIFHKKVIAFVRKLMDMRKSNREAGNSKL